MDLQLKELEKRDNYLIFQANNLARAFGNLTSFEHKVLDFAFSFVQKDDDKRKMYHSNIIDLIHYLGLNASGDSYKRVLNSFKALNTRTPLYIPTVDEEGNRGVIMTTLFDHVGAYENGKVEFRYSEDVQPYVFHLRKNFYAFSLKELARAKSKYTIIMLKLWNSNVSGWHDYENPNDLPPNVTINGTVKEWEDWFLGKDENGETLKWSPGTFKHNVLLRVQKEIESLYPKMQMEIITQKRGRKTVGYQVNIFQFHTNAPV